MENTSPTASDTTPSPSAAAKQVAEVYTSAIHMGPTMAIPETMGTRVEVVYSDGTDDEYTIWEYEDKQIPNVGDWITPTR